MSNKEYYRSQITLLSIVTFALVGAIILSIRGNILSLVWKAFVIAGSPIVIFWIVLIMDYIKDKRKKKLNLN